jgi:hypothetical protein
MHFTVALDEETELLARTIVAGDVKQKFYSHEVKQVMSDDANGEKERTNCRRVGEKGKHE